MTSSFGEAYGKVILFGEHAVVYGVPAIAVGIERGVRARATFDASGPSSHSLRLRRADAPDEVMAAFTDDTPLGHAYRALLSALADDGACPTVAHVEATTELAPGSGLGCSAALGVAIARALDPAAPTFTTLRRAAAWEQVFHGNASGIDASVAALGGCLLFERRPSPMPAELRPIQVPGEVVLCIGNSNIASSTKTMVDAVARLRERRPDTTAKTFAAIHSLVRNARLALEARDLRALGQLLDLNQMLLAGLFVSTPELEHMCALARQAGALGAKLTGGGGGGCVVALVDDETSAQAVVEAWNNAGYPGFFTHIGNQTDGQEAAHVQDAPFGAHP